MTKTQLCMELLADGPATTGDVAAALGWTSHESSAFMAYMHKAGRVHKASFTQVDTDTGNYAPVSLWVLPEHAEAWKAVPHPNARKPNKLRK